MLAGLIGVTRGDIVSIVGSGGKTSVMFGLARELRGFRTLVTTTVKIMPPEPEQYDFIHVGEDCLEVFAPHRGPGVYVAGGSMTEGGKIAGSAPERAAALAAFFDVCIIECDGSAGRPLKGWAEYEPVVPHYSTKTIGVITLAPLGAPISAEHVHRPERYRALLSDPCATLITPGQIKEVTLHPDGLFKNAAGEKILLVNQADTQEERERASAFLATYAAAELVNFGSVVAGSAKQGTFWRYK